MRTCVLLASSLLALLLVAPASAETVIRLDHPAPYDLQTQGFELAGGAEVELEAIGLGPGRGGWWIERLWKHDDERNELDAYAWLLDAETRKPVWSMTYADSTALSGERRRAETTLRLEPGRYELYYFSGQGWAARMDEVAEDGGDGDWWDRLHDRRREQEDLLEDLESCGVTLAFPGLAQRDVRRFEVDGDLTGTLISANRMGDSSFRVFGFRLERSSELRVYGVIEHRENDGDASDSAWIVNAATREVVFDASRTRTRRGGGGEKNRVIDSQIELPAGNYLLYAASDDSHSLDEFNAGAPWDPYNWGVTLLPGDRFDAAAFATFEAEVPPASIELTRVGSSRTLQQSFRLQDDARLWIHALGECSDETFFDGGWIVDAASGDVVWEMTVRNTRGGGGAAKNRMFDGIVELPRGDYVLYYVTDGSHAWDDWNAATPFRPEDWGVTVRPVPGEQLAGLALLEQDALLEAGGVLVRLVGIGDDERRGERFSVEAPTQLRVYALGEGESGTMFDYAYIVDSNGRHVWEMEYSDTRHAGGASKNRVVDERLRIEPGDYEVVYVSDGSHSAAGWNAGPPRDPVSWGVTVRRLADI